VKFVPKAYSVISDCNNSCKSVQFVAKEKESVPFVTTNPLFKIGQTDHGNRDGEDLWALQEVTFEVQQGEVLGMRRHDFDRKAEDCGGIKARI